jgi:hypothetical protein
MSEVSVGASAQIAEMPDRSFSEHLTSDLSSSMAAPTDSPSLVRGCRRWRSCFGSAYWPRALPVVARCAAVAVANHCALPDRATPADVPVWRVCVPRPPVCAAPLQVAEPYRQGFGPHRPHFHHRRWRSKAAARMARPAARACAVPAAVLRAGLAAGLVAGLVAGLGAAARRHCRGYAAAAWSALRAHQRARPECRVGGVLTLAAHPAVRPAALHHWPQAVMAMNRRRFPAAG